MNSLKEYKHIELYWRRSPHSKKEWWLMFDNEKVLILRKKGWFFFTRYEAEGAAGRWWIRKSEQTRIRFREVTLKGKVQDVLFNKKMTEGVLLTEWEEFKMMRENRKESAWFLDGREVMTFEKKSGSMSAVSFTYDELEERFLVMLLISGFMAVKGV